MMVKYKIYKETVMDFMKINKLEFYIKESGRMINFMDKEY